MKQSQFYYLLRRGLFKGMSIVREGLVMFNKFTTAGLSFPAQGSAVFNGSSDFIQTDNPFSHTNHTIAAWVYLDNSSATRIVFDNRDGGDDGIVLYFASNDQPTYLVNSAVIDASIISENNWYFAVGTYDGTTQKLYVDGSLISSQATSQTINTTTDAIIGARSHTSQASYMLGNLANVAIWNRALSSDEINSVMWKPVQALSATESNGLQAWYSLDDIASPTASLASMEQLATDKDVTIENKAAITAAVNSLS